MIRFVLTPLSPWATALRSDTLYGLICWQVAQTSGAVQCRQLIDSFAAGDAPFVLSSAMPANFLPMPCLPPIPREAFSNLYWQLKDELAKECGENFSFFAALNLFKKFRKQPFISWQAWRENHSQLSMSSLFKWHLRNSPPARAEDILKASNGEQGYEPHVSISRQSGTARDGQLFFRRLTYYPQNAALHLYARTDKPEWLLAMLQAIGDQGFGADASTGNGRFAVRLDEKFVETSPPAGQTCANLLLSTLAAPAMTNLSGWYRAEVKRGKTGPTGKTPFKKPFLFLREGALLTSLPNGPYVLCNINQDQDIVQILEPLTLACQLEGF